MARAHHQTDNTITTKEPSTYQGMTDQVVMSSNERVIPNGLGAARFIEAGMARTMNLVANFVVSLVFSKVVNAIGQEQTLRERLVNNIVGHLLNGAAEPVVQRTFEYWCNVDKDLGDRAENGVRAGSL